MEEFELNPNPFLGQLRTFNNNHRCKIHLQADFHRREIKTCFVNNPKDADHSPALHRNKEK
jgi:hypothetical protein